MFKINKTTYISKHRALVLCAAVLIYIGFRQIVAAQTPHQPLDMPSREDQLGLTITPAIFEQRIDAGKVRKRKLTLINKEDRYLPVTALIKPLIPYEEEIDPSKRESFDASQWIKLSETNFIMSPGQRKTLILTTAVPSNAEPGGHYASLQFEVLVPVKQPVGSTIAAAPRIASLAFITVPGPIYETLTLPEPVSVPKFTNTNPIKMSVPIKNPGNIHVLPTSKLVIGLKDAIISEIKLPPGFVLPNTIRTFMAEWPREKYMFGRFWVQAEATYGSPSQTIKSEIRYFYVAPWLVILLIVLSGGFIVFIIKTHHRWPAAWEILRKGK